MRHAGTSLAVAIDRADLEAFFVFVGTAGFRQGRMGRNALLTASLRLAAYGLEIAEWQAGWRILL